MELPLIIRGLIIGFSIAAPVGPIGILCIRRTLAYGRISGLVSGLGAATADAFYGSLAALGLSFLVNFLLNQKIWLQMMGGLFLIYLGLKTFFDKPVSIEHEPTSERLAVQREKSNVRARFSDYTSTLFLTLTNPLTILSFTAIYAGIGINQNQDSDFKGIVLVAGVFLGSSAWWMILSYLSSILKKRFASMRTMVWINRISGLAILTFGIVALSVSLADATRKNELDVSQDRMIPGITQEDSSGFTRVNSPLPLVFPEDHAGHPDYLTEWWYFTGNLTSESGREFGYQLTFFRRGLVPLDQVAVRNSDWGTSQAFMAHFALSDIQANEHYVFERLSRGSAGLAGSVSAPFRVWLYSWEVKQFSPTEFSLFANEKEISLELKLKDLKGPILHGDLGFSRKSSEPGQASMYYSLTRLISDGTLRIGNQTLNLSGFSWMDHEFSTSAFSYDLVGWDWFSMQMDNGSEIMLFQLRKADGSIDAYSAGTLVNSLGELVKLNHADFEVSVLKKWTSPHSFAEYPAEWLIKVSSQEIELRLIPCMADQELNQSYSYWEGCVTIRGLMNGEGITGKGYVELTGYAGSMGGEF